MHIITQYTGIPGEWGGGEVHWTRTFPDGGIGYRLRFYLYRKLNYEKERSSF